MRTINELFKILLEDVKGGSRIFICNAIDGLYNRNTISYSEFILLKTSFQKERPSTRRNKEFYEKGLGSKGGGWFLITGGEKVCSTRVKFLEMLVEKTKAKSKK